MACISTKLCMLTENKTMFHGRFCRQNSLPIKSNMAVDAILNFALTAITRSLLYAFAKNLAQRLKTTPRKQSYIQISLLRQSKMAAAAIWEIGLVTITRSLLHIFPRNFAKGSKNDIPQATLPSKFNS